MQIMLSLIGRLVKRDFRQPVNDITPEVALAIVITQWIQRQQNRIRQDFSGCRLQPVTMTFGGLGDGKCVQFPRKHCLY